MGPYAASKAAVARLTEALAAELGGRIRVNAVLPLTMDTPEPQGHAEGRPEKLDHARRGG